MIKWLEYQQTKNSKLLEHDDVVKKASAKTHLKRIRQQD